MRMARGPERGTALITGGMGFMGSNLALKLLSEGYDVIIYDAMLPQYGANPANIREVKDRIRLIIGDVRDQEKLRESLAEVDVVFHYAAQVSHVFSLEDPLLDVEINCKGTLNLLEAMRKQTKTAKLVYIGTRGQYGQQVYSPVDETHPEYPLDIYGVDKSSAEKYCFVYSRVHGMRVSSLRFTNTYGPRHQMKHPGYGILNWFIRKALLDETIEVWDGKQRRDYLFVDDASSAALLAAERREADGEVFVVSTSKSVSLLDAVKIVVDKAGSGDYVIKEYPEARKALEVGDVELSNRKIVGRLGWKASVNLPDGIERTIEFYRNRLREYM